MLTSLSPPSTAVAEPPTSSNARSTLRSAEPEAVAATPTAAPPPSMPRHRLRDISFAPVQRCGCNKHYEKPLPTKG